MQNKNWLRVQDFVDKTLRLVRISLFQNHNKEFSVFSRESYFIKAIENFSLCLHTSYKHSRRWENSRQLCRLRLGFAQLSRILPTPLVFTTGYANTGNVFYCLNSTQYSSSELLWSGVLSILVLLFILLIALGWGLLISQIVQKTVLVPIKKEERL